MEPTEVKGVETLNQGSCTIRTLTKTAPGQQWDLARELRRRILLRFREEGFMLALPQRVVWNKGLGTVPTEIE
jgi:small conductance mechanosensitive channel